MAGKTLADVHTHIRACQVDGTQRAVTICFLGDSNTRGMAIDPDRARRAFPARFIAELTDRYAPCAFNAIDAGIPGDTMTAALQRFDADVLRYAPDLTIIAFALNDATQGGREGLNRYRQSLHTALDRLLPTSAVMLLTPCRVATHATARVSSAHQAALPTILATQNEGILDAYVDSMRAVARERQVPLADAYALWQALAQGGVDTTAMLANGINHPFGYAHDLFVVPIMTCFEAGI